MTEFDAEREEEESTAALRSAAVEALQSAARQRDPKEFDRLTRYALGLIERARAITHRRRGGISGADGADTPDEHRAEEKQGPDASRKPRAKIIAKLWRRGLWRTGRR